jgi:hypothetical protein
MATADGGAKTCATGRETKQRSFLRDLEEKGVPFYSLAVAKMVHIGLAAVA